MTDIGATSNGIGDAFESLVEAARSSKPVSGLTHDFYRYPARFSPVFVRSAIEAFTEPGDWVVDPFAGGGTTLVEAMALGRNALGIDISSLSAFVCEAKTLLLSRRDANAFEHWMIDLPKTIDMHLPGHRFSSYADAGYYRNLSGSEFWRFRKAIEQCLVAVEAIRNRRAKTLARSVVLRTAQWALDARKKRPTIPQFRSKMSSVAQEMLSASIELRDQVQSLGLPKLPVVRSLHRPVAGSETDPIVAETPTPKLIVTSPPYPGIHVLYHRWQVDGRKEAPAPFWIANKLDGAGLSYYTMGDRKNPGLRTYFENLKANFASIAKMAGPETVIVQMVAFSERDWQLPEYLRVMEECGLQELLPWDMDDDDGRLWRDVPNRKWHAQQRSNSPGAKEVVLLHRKSSLKS